MGTRSDKFDIMEEFSSLAATMQPGFPFITNPAINDTTLVLLGTSLVDNFLKFVLISGFSTKAVSKRLIATVFEGHGPLATFSSKISLAVALGIVQDDVSHDLTLLRKFGTILLILQKNSACPISQSVLPYALRQI